MLRGVKPILLEGTDGSFDRNFQLIRIPLESAVEHRWAQEKYHFSRESFAYPELKVGNYQDWVIGDKIKRVDTALSYRKLQTQNGVLLPISPKKVNKNQ